MNERQNAELLGGAIEFWQEAVRMTREEQEAAAMKSYPINHKHVNEFWFSSEFSFHT